ncbi:MAG: class I SAM-dependent methyltransferase [Alphaproteobacteria bacterium]|nr:class I SAM-dependent methyltransferase [Alphaproteobacteria bacterium]
MEALVAAGRGPVEAVDASPEMIEAARARRGVQVRLADAAALPYDRDAFGAVVVATGVLSGDPSETPILAELRRVLRRGGRGLIALYHPTPWQRRTLGRVGVLADGALRRDRMVALWAQPDAWPVLVARWTGRRKLSGADRRLLEALSQEMGPLAAALRARGQDPVDTLTRAFAAPVPACDPDTLGAWVAAAGLRLVDQQAEDEVHLAIVEPA